jgi:hypothetical protein
MPRQDPDVLAGTRGPRTDRIEDMRQAAERAETEPVQVGPRRKQGTVYVSKFRRYRVQVTAPADVVDPLTGRKTRGIPVVAKFDEGVYVNDTKDLTQRAAIDTFLQENPYFGKYGSGAEFWLADDQESSIKAAKLKSARETLKSLPREAVAAFMAELQQGKDEDHTLPQR